MIHVDQIKKRQRQIQRATKVFKGRRPTLEMDETIRNIIRFGPRYGWNRTCRKRAKMTVRGTYKRHSQWRIAKTRKRMIEAAVELGQAIMSHASQDPQLVQDRIAIMMPHPADFLTAWQERYKDLNPTITSVERGEHAGQQVVGMVTSIETPDGVLIPANGVIIRNNPAKAQS
jgi:hypothetical protein